MSERCHFIDLNSEEKCSHTANFTLLFDKDLKVLVDDGYSQEDSCPRTDGTEKVRHDRQAAYTEATECSGCRDIPAEATERKKKNTLMSYKSIACNLKMHSQVCPVTC